MMESRISTLRQTLERVTTQVTEPYNKISTRTAQLARLQTACELLRKIIRLIYLIKRLKSLMRGGSKEIAKIAQTISEIGELQIVDRICLLQTVPCTFPFPDQVMKGSDLNGIQVSSSVLYVYIPGSMVLLGEGGDICPPLKTVNLPIYNNKQTY